ncbi:pentapeptide repeat-containing protein [Neomegalonema sp.]|uniref:pentapeptide repeat-containing protein n=1 Tax=Neomegalonema sp. TaxID=2039713 RepID=UPI00260F3546|nr:pentapeptide repeat-containing protein [Neomegalonema sp.]MDD2869629.1 pentapeptide repeat-containing protein [Neomegalonema sp.]
MKKIEIKNRFTGEIIMSGKYESIKDALEKNTDANLTGAYLTGANLTGANLTGANLTDAYLTDAYLTGTYLTGANLTDAYLTDAYLTDAYLTGANLTGANLTGAKGLNYYLVTPLLILKEQPGKIRTYKLVNSNGEGPYNGGIKYEIGKTYQVADANADINEQCGAGINLATLDWCMKEWREGYKILIAEHTAKDIACIPIASDGKYRVFRARIVGEKDLKEIGLIK